MGFFATANWDVIGYPTVGIDAASALTRIHANVLLAVLVARTIGAENAFGPARAVRIADVIRRTDAIDGPVLLPALSVGTARIGIARSWWLNNVRFDYFKLY